MKLKKKMIVLISALLVIVIAVIWIAWGNKALALDEYTVSGSNLPAEFNDFTIAHVSDLHNTSIGKNNQTLLDMLRSAKPCIIALTGDMVDSRKTDISVSLDFVREAVKIAPCYYVNGNHESRIDEYDIFIQGLKEAGVTVLENETAYIEISGKKIAVMGINDPSFYGDNGSVAEKLIAECGAEENVYTVLLSHRPELFDVYVKCGIDLVLSGHAHGGQIRLPFIGGLFAPHQGILPEYDQGLYTLDNTNMLVSRGIGNSLFPFRVNNRPQVIMVTLTTK